MGALLLLVFVFACGSLAFLLGVAANLLGVLNVPGNAAPFTLALGGTALVVVLAGLLLAGRALRHTAMPLGDVMEATGRLAEGDYSVQVVERGPLPHIFDRFYKSPDSRGAGLGLAIAKNLIVVHGGEIEAKSELGAGATIRFKLPVQA